MDRKPERPQSVPQSAPQSGPQREDAALAELLRTGPFHEALRTAISHRGLGLQRIQHRLAHYGLAVGLGTLSYWQQGRRRPERPESLRAVQAIEEILELPASSLTGLLGPRRPRGRSGGRPEGSLSREKVMPDLAGRVVELLAALDGYNDEVLRTLGQIERVAVGTHGGISVVNNLQVFSAYAETDRYVALFSPQEGGDLDLVTTAAQSNCRVGRVRTDSEINMVATELLFDRRLRRGDTQLVQYETTDDNRISDTEYRRIMRLPTRQYVLQVNFDSRLLPARVQRFYSTQEWGTEQDSQELTLDPHHSVHYAADDPDPGVLGIRWIWD